MLRASLTVRPHQKRIERPNRRKSFTFYGQERPKRPKRPTLPAAKVERPERQKEVENFLTLCK